MPKLTPLSDMDVDSLTEEQKLAIAEARRTCEARTAECRILHESALATTFEPEARQEIERELRRELERFG